MYTPIPGSNHSSVIMQITTLPRLCEKIYTQMQGYRKPQKYYP